MHSPSGGRERATRSHTGDTGSRTGTNDMHVTAFDDENDREKRESLIESIGT
jgi:hypothetical protein